MSKWILAISVGPVGGFIAAGRRSRDLWAGSALLSNMVRAIASDLQQLDAELLLPKLDERTSPSPYRGSVANKLVLHTDSAEQARELASRARRLAHDWLAQRLEDARPRVQELIDLARFNAQVEHIRKGDFIELRAGWAPEERGFREAFKEACRRRDASPRLFIAPCTEENVPKCHLDPGRDSVLKDRTEHITPQALVRRLRLGVLQGEELDSLYLVRRLGAFSAPDSAVSEGLPWLPFPPLARVAATPWLAGADHSLLEQLCKQLKELEGKQREDFFAWCSPANLKDDTTLPYDASILFEGAMTALDKTLGRGKLEELQKSLRTLAPSLARLTKDRGHPIPYFALVEMDGDGVGAALADLHEAPWKEAIGQLYKFSDAAAEIIQRHGGVPFYAAADELMFYIPVDTALAAVRDLQARWGECSEPHLSRTTLSAGVLIAHIHDDLEFSRKAAHRALQDAKRWRQARSVKEAVVRVVEAPRAADARGVTGLAANLIETLNLWSHAFEQGSEGVLSLRTAHILDEHITRLKDTEGMVLLSRRAVLSQFQRSSKTGASERPTDPARARVWEAAKEMKYLDDVAALRDKLLIAARIGRVSAQRTGAEHG